MDFSNTSISDLAATVAEYLQQHGIEVVLVGGLAVEIYTENLYLTKDIDMVNTNYPWYHPSCKWSPLVRQERKAVALLDLMSFFHSLYCAKFLR